MAALIIALNDLQRVLRERQNLFWIFVAPLIFAGFFGLLLQPGPARPTKVTVVDEDREGHLGVEIARFLNSESMQATVAPRPARSGGFVLTVPAGASQAIASNRGVRLVLEAGREQSEQERRLQFKIQKALVSLSLDGGAAEGSDGPIAIEQASFKMRSARNVYGFQHSIPAYLVMFVFINLMVAGAGIAEERVTGRLRRLAVAPVNFNQIVLGKLLVRLVVGWTQMAYMLFVGIFFFGVEWGTNPVLLGAFLSVFALGVGALGILAGTLFRDADKCRTFAVWSVMILSPLGGLWWPLEVVGPTLRKVAYFVPTGWAMEGVNSLMAFGGGVADVAPFAAAFAALFVVSFVLATRRLRRLLVA